MTDCPHAYRIKKGLLWFCVQCQTFLTTEHLENGQGKSMDSIVMPPHHFEITERLWEEVNPWKGSISFDTIKKNGWYISVIGMDDYLVMPIPSPMVGSPPTFYSARRLTDNGGLKYSYPKNGKKLYWISSKTITSQVILCEGVADAAYISELGYTSVALLGNYYDGSLDNHLGGRSVILLLDGDAMGVVGAMRILKSLRMFKAKFIMLPDKKDPTDLTHSELRKLING